MTNQAHGSERRPLLFAIALAFGACMNACGAMVTSDAATSDARSSETTADGSSNETGTPADVVVPDGAPSDVTAGDDAADRVEPDVASDTIAIEVDASSDTDAMDLDASSDVAVIEVDASRDAGSPPDAAADGSVTPTHTCPTSLPRFDLRADFHAVGDGMADDTDALHDAAVAIDRAGGGELVIPPGTYRVGRQAMGAMTGLPFYRPAPMFVVDGVSCLQISGYGATLRLTSRLHYGSFDPDSGAPIPGPTTDPRELAQIGRMFQIDNSQNVLVEGLELDGNNTALVLGGEAGNVDRQTIATGISLNRDSDVHVRDLHTHHHGLDGITVLYRGGTPPRRMPHLLERVNSEYNGRQAISWIGGWGLEAVDCQFNHTGRAINHGGGVDDGMPLASLPRAGIDIEPNAGTTEQSRDGQFTRCEFIDNAGPGMLADVGDGGYSTFTDCTFWGTTSYSVWAKRPALRFVNSHVYGTVVHPYDGNGDATLATVFEGCDFEDRPWTDGRVYRNGYLVNVGAEGDDVTFRACTFTNHEVRDIYDSSSTTREIFDACTFRFDNNTLAAGSNQTSFSGSRITSTHFGETSRITRNYGIGRTSVVVAAPAAGARDTVVDGPHVTWGGRTGVIAPGMY